MFNPHRIVLESHTKRTFLIMTRTHVIKDFPKSN